MNIPRKQTDQVKQILNSDITNKDKAQQIQDFDYSMKQRETSKPVYRRDLISVEEIEKAINENT